MLVTVVRGQKHWNDILRGTHRIEKLPLAIFRVDIRIRQKNDDNDGFLDTVKHFKFVVLTDAHPPTNIQPDQEICIQLYTIAKRNNKRLRAILCCFFPDGVLVDHFFTPVVAEEHLRCYEIHDLKMVRTSCCLTLRTCLCTSLVWIVLCKELDTFFPVKRVGWEVLNLNTLWTWYCVKYYCV